MTDIVTITLNPAVDFSTAVDKIVPVAKLRGKSQRRDPGGGINVDARRNPAGAADPDHAAERGWSRRQLPGGLGLAARFR